MKLAVFDVDWTLIKPKEGRTFPKDRDDWQWTYDSVEETLRNYAIDYQIVFVTDQSKAWKVAMIDDIIQILNINVIRIISMNKETNKPNRTLFDSYIKSYNKKASFYVGDAGGDVGDWSDVDKMFAENIGVQFYKPEDIFPTSDTYYNYDIEIPRGKEILIMVGYPGSGKSTFCEQLTNYHTIHGDVFKTPEKMIKEARKYPDKSIIFDATNGTVVKRAKYIDYAKSIGLPVRIVWISTDIDTSISNIAKRVKNGGNHVSKIALYTYRKNFEEPTVNECELVVY